MPSPGFEKVSRVIVEENQDAFMLCLLRDETSEGAYLILQCSQTPPTASDVANGLDTYCLLDQNGAVHYGGVTRAVLGGSRLWLSFTDEAAEELGVLGANTITLAVPPRDTRRVSDALRRIFTHGNPDRLPRLVGI
jgi:hypothetical protein